MRHQKQQNLQKCDINPTAYYPVPDVNDFALVILLLLMSCHCLHV